MAERKWTKGPWFPAYWSGEINGGESGGKPVIDMNTETFDRVTACVEMDDEERANFTLISAAPEMYEVLDALAYHPAHQETAMGRRARDVLAKARGEA